MNDHPPSLCRRIDELEVRVARRQERLPLRWHEAQRATSTLLRVDRSLPLIAIATAIVAAYLVLRRPAQAVKAGGVAGMLVTTGLTLLRPRYGALYSLAWELLKGRYSTSARSSSAHRAQR
jgi:hypothetical protein